MLLSKRAQNLRDIYIILVLVIAISLVIFWMFWSLPTITQQNENRAKKETLFARQNIGILSYRIIENKDHDLLELTIKNNYEGPIQLENISIQNQVFILEKIKVDINQSLDLNITLGQKCEVGDYYSFQILFGISKPAENRVFRGTENQKDFLVKENKSTYKFPLRLAGRCITP